MENKDSDLIQFRKILLVVVTGKCFKYKDVYYEQLGFTKMKDPNTREWLMAVRYRPILKNEIDFARELKEFNSRFVKVNNLDEIQL